MSHVSREHDKLRGCRNSEWQEQGMLGTIGVWVVWCHCGCEGRAGDLCARKSSPWQQRSLTTSDSAQPSTLWKRTQHGECKEGRNLGLPTPQWVSGHPRLATVRARLSHRVSL